MKCDEPFLEVLAKQVDQMLNPPGCPRLLFTMLVFQESGDGGVSFASSAADRRRMVASAKMFVAQMEGRLHHDGGRA